VRGKRARGGTGGLSEGHGGSAARGREGRVAGVSAWRREKEEGSRFNTVGWLRAALSETAACVEEAGW
jgi:hypothetical protein